jgi:hypothetical protein
MKKMKRYEDGGDIDALEAANKSDESQSIADEAKGEAMLKSMRDKASAPKPRAKPAMPALEMNVPRSKPKSTQYGASVPNIGASGTFGGGLGRRSHPEYTEDASRARADMKKTSTPDVTKMSANERTKQNIEDTKQNIKENLASARSGSGKTDSRSVNERIRSGIRSTLGFAKGGSVNASSRADGIAQRGKTRGKMI